MTSYFRRAELMGLSQLRSKQDLVPSSSRTLKHRDTYLKKRDGPPWNHRDQCQGSDVWPSGKELGCRRGNSWEATRQAAPPRLPLHSTARGAKEGLQGTSSRSGGQPRPGPSEPDGLSLCPIPPAPRGQLLVMRVPGKQMGSRAA